MVRLPACFKVSTWKPGPEPREKSESAPLIDDDLPLHNFKSVTLFMRRRSAWLCVAGAVLAYFAFLPPLLVIVPLMTEQFCTEWHAGTGVVITLQSNGAIAPECATLSELVRLLPHDFFRKATVSNLASNFDTAVGRVFLACVLLSSLSLLASEFPFWLPRRWHHGDSIVDRGEGVLRFVWLVLGTLSTAVVAIVPSPDGAQGIDLLLTAIHNATAVIGYGTLVFMELAQLHLGENVFRRARSAIRQRCCGAGGAKKVFRAPRMRANAGAQYSALEEGDDPDPATDRDYWQLNWDQWLRGIIMLAELATGVTFISVQGMLFFGAQSQALAYYSVFLETGFALLIYGDLFVMGMHGILMDVSNVDP